ncbi:MAG: TetR/AcrR family transcriptional regulator [Jatrophihabitans sp.]
MATTGSATGPVALLPLPRRFELVFDAEPELGQLTGAARRVLAVAAALFFEQGSAATSVRELTRACGLSPGALYNHFGSRDELLFTLVRTGHVRAQRDLDAALATGPGTAHEQLIGFVRAYTEIHLRFPPFAQLIHREYVHLSPARKAEIIRRRRRMRDQLVAILQAGVAEASFALVGGANSEVGSAMMVLDMCSRTSEWFNPAQPSAAFTERYAIAALRLVGARERSPARAASRRPR